MSLYIKKSEPKGAVKPKLKKHVIEDISFSNDYIKCSCGWEGKTTEHDAHRKEVAA